MIEKLRIEQTERGDDWCFLDRLPVVGNGKETEVSSTGGAIV
jgi:hypothetical protein